jgi:hypothetical protein
MTDRTLTNSDKDKRTVIVHLGLHRTGSSYLQRHVFPGLEGVFYAGKGFSKLRLPAIMMTADKVILFSNESWLGRLKLDSVYNPSWDWLEHSILAIRNTAATFGDPHGLIVLRKHSGWINSLYGMYLANGGCESFENFYGKVKKKHEFLLGPRCRAASHAFTGGTTFLNFADLTGPSLSWEKSLSRLLRTNVVLPPTKENPGITQAAAQIAYYIHSAPRFRFMRWLRVDPLWVSERVAPWCNSSPIDIGEEWRQKIDEDFADDWSEACSYIKHTSSGHFSVNK